MSVFQNLRYCLSNLPSWRTDRKIVVFESDDWGSILMSSKVKSKGIKYIMLDKLQKVPFGNGVYKTHLRYLGKKNQLGQIYMSQNAGFEPSQFPDKDKINLCLRSIETMFKLKKPATISTHRVNYIGWLNQTNRNNTLSQLNQLLKQIVSRWPDVEFMTTDQLGDHILIERNEKTDNL